ncbi:MAG: class II glutamine amidotransferase [Oscillospiraceae bacterium]
MCAIFGFLDYKGILSNTMHKKLINALAVNAEIRGTDATGISYINDGKLVTFKKAKPAHKVKLYFPAGTKAVIGHTRFTTQGSEKHNYNNHPFEGKTDGCFFALAHNGVLHNDKELKSKYNFPETEIETDSYVAVQLLEHQNAVDFDTIKNVAETVQGSFMFTILKNDNTLFLVKGSNPIAIYHFPEYGLYVYASTKEILEMALLESGFAKCKHERIVLNEGDILKISADGKIEKSQFEVQEDFFTPYRWHDYYDWCEYCDAEIEEDDVILDDIAFLCYCFGVSEADIETLLDYGYTLAEIEDLLLDTDCFEEALKEAKTLLDEC